MLRLTRALLLIAAAALIAAPTAADARAAPLQTLRLRVPIPAAGDLSILSFELSIGGEGRRHRRQLVSLKLVNHRETGVFAVERLRPVHGHLGRFLGVIEVFHRASAKAASLPAELDGFARASPFGAHAAREFNDEFFVRAHNEHVIKEKLKDNIVMLAEAHKIGPDEFCDPHNLGTYLLGSELIGAAYDQAGPVTGLPTNTDVSQLADDAVNELCDAVEDFHGGDELLLVAGGKMLAMLEQQHVAGSRMPGKIAEAVFERVPVAAEPVGESERLGHQAGETLLVVHVTDVHAPQREARRVRGLGNKARVRAGQIDAGLVLVLEQLFQGVTHGSA